MTRTPGLDRFILEAALFGLQQKRNEIDAKIADVRSWIAEEGQVTSHTTGQDRRKRPMSAAARKRIAAAQRKRWAAYRKAKESK